VTTLGKDERELPSHLSSLPNSPSHKKQKCIIPLVLSSRRKMDEQKTETGCCPRFNPEPWDLKEFHWDNKMFVKDHIKAVAHIPLNFGTVITRVFTKVNKAGALDTPVICLSDEKSPWGSDMYLATTKEVPDAQNVTISGDFLTKVFEGSFKDMKKWTTEMEEYVKSKGKEVKKLYFFYTTCPKCAKKYGENYVVLFAQV
jgi:hypothetical protein